MDAAPEARRKEMLDKILAMAMEMASELKACNAELKSCRAAFRSAPPAFVVDSDSGGREVGATTDTKLFTAGSSSLSSPAPSPTSAPDHDATLDHQFGVTKLPARCSTPGPYQGVHFPALGNSDHRDREVPNSSSNDLEGVDRFSLLPDSLLCDIVARLPIKDAGRTAVLSRRWSPIWRAAPLVVGHADLAVLHLNFNCFHGLVPRSPDGLLEQIDLQQQGGASPLLVNNDPGGYLPASDASWPPTSAGTKSWPMRPRCWTTRQYPPSPASAITVSSTKLVQVMFTRCLMLCLYQTFGQELHTTSEISASSEVMVLSCPATSTCDAYKVFKVMPVFLFLPPSSCSSVWNLHTVYKGDDKFLKSPWPPPTQDECQGSTLSLYRYTCVPVRVITFSAMTSNQDIKLDVPVEAAEYPLVQHVSINYVLSTGMDGLCFSSSIRDAREVFELRRNNLLNISCINYGQGNKMPKPPWLLGAEAFHSWSGRMQWISGFLLEVLPWCKDYMKWVQWKPYMTPPVQLKKASRGTNLQLLPCLFIVCTGAEAKQSKFLLVLMSGICYVELPIMHSKFQSYILVSEVLSGKPEALHFICRYGGKFLLQPWSPPDPFLALGDQFSLCGNQLVVECGGLQPKPPWSLVFPEDDSIYYDPSKHVWLLLLDCGKIQKVLLSSIQVNMHRLVHEMIAMNMNLQLVWNFSDEEIHPRIWLFKCNQIDVVPLQVLLCWSILIDCFSSAQWKYDTVMINDEIATLTLSRNYLLGHQLSYLYLEMTAAELELLVSDRRNVHVQQKFKFSHGLLTSNMEDQEVILWDPGGAKLLTIRLMVFFLLPCSPCWWYGNFNRCCITHNSNYWSSWVLVPFQNISRETTSVLNASMQLILLQDNEAKVQVFQYGQYLCYLKQFDDDWCDGRSILSIVGVRVTWDPGGLKFVTGFAATAWGQAVFQEGEYVMILPEILWAGPIKGHMAWAWAREEAILGLASWPTRKALRIKGSPSSPGSSVEGPDTEPAAASSAPVEASDCSRLAFARLCLLLPPPNYQIMYPEYSSVF